MPNLRPVAIATILALTASPVLAQGASELATIRQQIQDLQNRKAEDEKRIADLESRLARAEAAVRNVPPAVAMATPSPSATAPASAPTRGPGNLSNAFNPAIGAILNGTYGQYDRKPDDYSIPGFALGEETGPGTRGFGLGESEINVSANADHLFFGSLTVALSSENEVEVEEAFVESPGLGHGITVKAGRFFSGIGYMNAQHSHAWDFADTALPYRAFLGNQFGDDGVQVRWVAPVDLFLELGGEMSRGDDFPAAGNARSGKGAWAAFARVGGDLGTNANWRLGGSYLDTRAQGRETGAGPDTFGGESNLWIADAVFKWAPTGNPAAQNVKLQAEYFWREEDGTFNAQSYKGDQTGWYAQAVYQFMPRWRAGYRFDALHADSLAPAFAGTTLDTRGRSPQRNSLMVDFNPTEFSRLRLQYNRDESGLRDDDQIIAQYIISLGAHGAHPF